MRFETADMTEKNIDKIAALFPNCVTEMRDENGKIKRGINFEMLRQMLSPDVVDGDECYEFTWVGKKASIVEANKPIRKTLRPCIEESKDWDTTENLYIEGDNLEVLKLLQESYMGKVKMIYIDPPYNTGSDFIYADDFMRSQKEENEQMGMYDEDENRLFKNTDSNGRFHSDWCSMMYPRLMLARNLLADDGAVFISISDDEEENLIKLCSAIFGKQNFIANICHKSRASISNDRIISENHNHLLFYAKNEPTLFAKKNEIGDDPDLSGFTLHDEKGYYKLTPVDGPGGAKKGNPYYEFLGVAGYWRYSKETMQKRYNEGLIVRTQNGLQQKYYKHQAEKSRKTVTTWWDDGFLTSSATSELAKLMEGKTFDNPKNVNVVLRAIKMVAKTDRESIIIDFFSGAATTAHAVMQLNAEDGGHRKFIMVQLPEKCDEKSEAYKAGYRNICEIGKERIRRAGEKIKAEGGLTAQNLDVGFRVLKLADSNMKDVYYAADEYSQSSLMDMISNIKEDRTDLDLLFGCLIDWGVPLSMPYKSEQLDGCTVHVYNDGDLVACFDETIPESVVRKIAERKPLRTVFRDSGFADSPAKINMYEIFKIYMPEDADDITKRVRVI